MTNTVTGSAEKKSGRKTAVTVIIKSVHALDHRVCPPFPLFIRFIISAAAPFVKRKFRFSRQKM